MSESRAESEERERRADEMGEREREAKRGTSQEGFDMNDASDRQGERRERSPRSNSNCPSRREESQNERSRNEGGAGEDDCNGGERRSGSQQRSSGTVRTRRGGDTDTLYITNLPHHCGTNELRRIFQEVGEVKDCRIVNNPVTRESRGFAFLSYVDPSLAAVAIERFDDKVAFPGADRPMRVERAKRNKPHNPTPGFYKGPPGASIKYDKSGRLKPGFLPYYAVHPGASREFVHPSNYNMDYGGPRGPAPGRWPDDREWGPRGGYDPSGRYYDRVDYNRGGPVDVRGGTPDYQYDMRMERGYDSRGRGGGDGRSGVYDRGSGGVYDSRGYDRVAYDNKWQQYDDPRYDSRYGGYTDYYGSGGSHGGYDVGRGRSRDVDSGRDRSRSFAMRGCRRSRRDRRRSSSLEGRHHRSSRR